MAHFGTRQSDCERVPWVVDLIRTMSDQLKSPDDSINQPVPGFVGELVDGISALFVCIAHALRLNKSFLIVDRFRRALGGLCLGVCKRAVIRTLFKLFGGDLRRIKSLIGSMFIC